jgi:Chitobiase/beta-hexosaminidase C-terminal domain/Glycosyl hydrolases family 43
MAFIQTANSGTPSGNATVKTVTYAGAQTAGNLNIVGIAFGTNGSQTIVVPSITVTDSKGNTYVQIGPFKQHPAGGSSNGTVLFYAQNIAAATAGANAVTVTLGTTQGFFIVSVFEFSGINPSSVVDTYVNNALPTSPGSSPTAVTSGPLTTSSSNELLFGFCECSDVPASIGVDYTQVMLQYVLIAGYKTAPSSGIYSFTATSAGTTAGWSVWLVAFRQSGTVPPPATTFVQKANSGTPSGTATTKSVTLSGQAAGNMNFVYLSYGNGTAAAAPPGTVVSIKDDLNNSYLPAAPAAIYYDFFGHTSLVAQSFYLPQIPAGNRTITATLSAACSFFILGAAEYTINGATPLISSASYYGSNTTGAGNAPGTAASGNVYVDPNVTLIGFLAASSGMTSPGPGYSVREQIYTIMLEDQQVGNAGVYNASATAGNTSGWVAQVCAFTVLGTPSLGYGEVLLNNPYTASTAAQNVSALSDGNSWTFWTNAPAGANFAQINAGAACRLSRIRYSVFAGGEDLIAGCTITACNEPSFTIGPVTTLYTIPSGSRATAGDLKNEVVINAPSPWQYYRFNTLNYASALEDLDIYVYPAPGCVFRPGDLTLSPCTGNYDLPIYLTFSSPLTAAATIHYTTDGSGPTSASPTYTGPFVVSATTTVQAVAFSPASVYASRTLSRPVHIGATEVSTDIIYDNRNYRLWALNGSLWFDPKSKYWYRTGSNWDTPLIYTYGFPGNNVYRSADLRNWEFRATIMQPPAGQMDGQVTNTRWSIAAKTLYNALNNNYVCWSDDYVFYSQTSFASQGKTCWTAPTPEGPYTLIKSFTTIGSITGTNPSWGANTGGDFSLFLDHDGVTAYLVGTCASGTGPYENDVMTIGQLNASYTDFVAVTTTPWSSIPGLPFSPKTCESTWITYHNGTYFMMASPTTGWNPNQNFYLTSSSPMGPWSGYTVPFLPVPGGTPDYTVSYDGQGWNIITIPGRSGGYIWHADRHDAITQGEFAADFHLSRRLRLPVIFSTTGASYTIPWNAAWSFDSAMPTLFGAPAAPSLMVLNNNGTTATWINNERGPHKLYIDQAKDVGFLQIISSSAIPDGATSVVGLPMPAPGTYQRIRAVNYNGTSTSNVANRDNVIPGADINPPFMPVSFPPGPPTVPAWEDGPGAYVDKTGAPIRYNGQGQSSTIFIANPPPKKHFFPHAAPPSMSQIPP